jgi:hypothetical protein
MFVRARRAFWFTTSGAHVPAAWRRRQAAYRRTSSFKMIAFDFSGFAQHRDDRGSAKFERLGPASINCST